MSKKAYNTIKQVLDQASPADGYGVKEVIVGDEHSLHIVLRINGVVIPLPMALDPTMSREVWAKKDMTDADYGEKARLRLLLEAGCRYLNTGGDWVQLEDTFKALWQFSSGQVALNLPGYHLISSAVNTDGEYEHLFAAENSPYAVRWVENSFLEAVLLTDVRNELAEEAADDFAESASDRGLADLRGPADSGDPQDDPEHAG